jgi:hypothetical protein
MTKEEPRIKTRNNATLAAAKRSYANAEVAKKRAEAALVTRDAAMAAAMADGWTSDEIGEEVGATGRAIRNLLYIRRKGRPGRRREEDDS